MLTSLQTRHQADKVLTESSSQHIAHNAHNRIRSLLRLTGRSIVMTHSIAANERSCANGIVLGLDINGQPLRETSVAVARNISDVPRLILM